MNHDALEDFPDDQPMVLTCPDVDGGADKLLKEAADELGYETGTYTKAFMSDKHLIRVSYGSYRQDLEAISDLACDKADRHPIYKPDDVPTKNDMIDYNETNIDRFRHAFVLKDAISLDRIEEQSKEIHVKRSFSMRPFDAPDTIVGVQLGDRSLTWIGSNGVLLTLARCNDYFQPVPTYMSVSDGRRWLKEHM